MSAIFLLSTKLKSNALLEAYSMEDAIQKLEQLIREKVDEGIFSSLDHAVHSISIWLNDLEEKFIEEQMRNEDA